MTEKKKKWSSDKLKILLNYLFVYEDIFNDQFSDKNEISTHLKIISEGLADEQYVYDKNSILSTLFSQFGFLCSPIKMNNGYSQFLKNKNKIIKFKPHLRQLIFNFITDIKNKQKISDIFEDSKIQSTLNFDPDKTLNHNIADNIKLFPSLTFIDCVYVFYNDGKIGLKNNKIITTKSSVECVNIEQKKSNLLINEKEFQIMNNDIRKNISQIFDHTTNKKNLFLINDGTGSGKTYNSIARYIQQYSNNKNLHSFIFSAPQKNQLSFAKELKERAFKNDIPIFMYKSNEDLANMSGIDLTSPEQTTIYRSISDILDLADKSIIKKLNKDLANKYKETEEQKECDEEDYNEDLEQLSEEENFLDDSESSFYYERESQKEVDFKTLKNILSSLNSFYETNKKQLSTSFDKDIQKELNDKKNGFINYIYPLTVKLIKIYNSDQNSFKISMHDYFLQTEKYHKHVNSISEKQKKDLASVMNFLFHFIGFVYPFEIAKYKNIIILITTDKMCFNVVYCDKNKHGLPTIINTDLYTAISGVEINYDTNIINHEDDDLIVGEFLQNKFLKQNQNYFIEHNIGFSLIIDEEHIAYNKILKRNSQKNIVDQKNNILHSLIGIYHWKTKMPNTEEEGKQKIFQLQKKYAKITYDLLISQGVFSEEKEIDNFIENLTKNEYLFFAKRYDREFIQMVCSNILTLSPKILNNAETLKNIKLKNKKFTSSLYTCVDKKENTESIEIDLFKIVQIVLCLLYALKDIKNNEYRKFRKFKKNQQNEEIVHSQFNPLYNIILTAINHKEYLKLIFDAIDNLNENQKIDLIFAYFLPKLNFQIEELESVDPDDSEYFFFSLNINMIRQLPEVEILRALKNKNNKIFLLSATRGFKGIHSGNFSENFFETINQRYIPDYFKIEKRELYDDNAMPLFTTERFKQRNSVSFIHSQFKTTGNNATFSNHIYSINDISEISKNNVLKTDHLVEPPKELLKLTTLLTKNIKKHSSYFNISNYFHQKEADLICCSILSAISKNENAMILSLTNKFSDIVKSDFFDNIKFKQLIQLNKDENYKKIIDIKPFIPSNENPSDLTYRIIFFDAELGKTEDLDSLTKEAQTDPNLKIIVISSYVSAGTGLNITIGDFDFDALYLTRTPYYSDLKDKKNSPYNVIALLVLMKKLAECSQYDLKYFKKGFHNQECQQIFYNEHLFEEIKAIMQAIGRIERRNCKIDTKIYFMEKEEDKKYTLFHDIIMRFILVLNLYKDPKSTIIENMSFLNRSMLNVAEFFKKEYSLTPKQCNELENKSYKAYSFYRSFFEDQDSIFIQSLREYRNNNKDYDWFPEFNEILRNYILPDDSFEIDMNNFIIKYKPKLSELCLFDDFCNFIKKDYFFIDGNYNNKMITINNKNNAYTDIEHSGFILENPFDFGSGLDLNLNYKDENSHLSSVIKNYNKKSEKILNETNNKRMLINLYFNNILKGNKAEYFFKEWLKYHEMKFNNVGEFFDNSVVRQLYELFDFYIINNKTKHITAIDVKNWRLNTDKNVSKLESRHDLKTKKISEITALSQYSFSYYYINLDHRSDSALGTIITDLIGNKAQYIPFFIEDYTSLNGNKKHIINPKLSIIKGALS